VTYLPNKAPAMFGAKHIGQRVEICVGDDEIWAAYLGRGRFTTAFRAETEHGTLSRAVYLYTFHEDFSKSILAHTYRQYASNPHLPEIVRVGRMRYRGQMANVYKARYYKPIDEDTKLTQANRDTINVLQGLHEEACDKFRGSVVRTRRSSEFNQFITQGMGQFRLPYLVRAALEALAEEALDWGDHYLFDSFKLRNLALDGKGRLILIDPMFDMAKIEADHEARRACDLYTTET
jgi:hypothetical protein